MDQNGSQYAVTHYINNIKKNIQRIGRKQSRTGENKVERVISESEVDRRSTKTQFWVASLRGTKLEVVGISFIDS